MGIKISAKNSRKASARLDLLRQELLAPILSIEGHAELLKEQVSAPDCLADLEKIVSAATLTRTLVEEMLSAEEQQRDDAERDRQRSHFKHDLRNPVGGVSGYSEITLEELEDAEDLGADTQTYLNHQLADSRKFLQIRDALFQSEYRFG